MSNLQIVVEETGGPEVLRLVEGPIPEPGPGQVRVRVLTCGLAFADVTSRRGQYPAAPKRPFTTGYDAFGVVDAVGSGGNDLAEGQRVGVMFPKFGGSANYAIADYSWVVPAPDGLNPVQAVAIVLNYLTAIRMLDHVAQLTKDSISLVHAGAGGVGSALLDLAQSKGLKMFATVSAQKQHIVEQFGATPIDYRTEDFVARIQSECSDGVDAVFDGIGGKTTRQSYRILKKGGKLMTYGYVAAANAGGAAVPMTLLYLATRMLIPDGKRAVIVGDAPSLATKQNGWYRQHLSTLFEMLKNGEINPVTGATLPLEQAVKAHQLMEDAAVVGKIVLVTDEALLQEASV